MASVVEYIESTTLLLCKYFDMSDHISKTGQRIKNDDYVNYIVLSLEVYQETEKIFQNKGFYEYVQLVGNLRRNSERWIFLKDKMPDDAILKNNYKAVIIPGSHSSVYDYEPHTLESMDWLREFKINKKEELSKIKLLGICFGHQIINEALGGKVRKIPSGEFLKFVELVKIDGKFWNFPFVKNSCIKKLNV